MLETPAGRLGVLLGGTIEQFQAKAIDGEAVELLAMPSDLDGLTDDADFTEQLQAQGIRAGVKVHLRGRLWERSGQSQALAFDAGRSERGASERGAQLINLWL